MTENNLNTFLAYTVNNFIISFLIIESCGVIKTVNVSAALRLADVTLFHKTCVTINCLNVSFIVSLTKLGVNARSGTVHCE